MNQLTTIRFKKNSSKATMATTLFNEKITRTQALHCFFSKAEQIQYNRKKKLVPWCLSADYMFVDVSIPRACKR